MAKISSAWVRMLRPASVAPDCARRGREEFTPSAAFEFAQLGTDGVRGGCNCSAARETLRSSSAHPEISQMLEVECGHVCSLLPPGNDPWLR